MDFEVKNLNNRNCKIIKYKGKNKDVEFRENGQIIN